MNTHVAPIFNDRKIVHELPTGTLTVEIEKSLLTTEDIFGFAARANPKRGFLFMSKVLGKHYPTKPSLMRHIHSLLANQIPAELPSPIVFIAMAETAIGLGHGVFDQFCSKNPAAEAMFLHSTRYHIADSKLVEFEEAHSHAPRQFLHLPQDEKLFELFRSARSIVILDDEASTGNTFVNLVKSCRALNANITNVHLSVITNFMGNEQSKADYLTHRFELPTTIGSVLTGNYTFTPGEYLFPPAESQKYSPNSFSGASTIFGRSGISKRIAPSAEFISSITSRLTKNDKVLLVGTGEFMHFPFILGCILENQGFDVYIQSSTRSPILKWGPIEEKLSFTDNYNEGIDNFLYNVTPQQYDKVFIFHETPINQNLIDFSAIINANLFRITENEIEQYSFC